MDSYKILFFGDVVGRPGREAIEHWLPRLKAKHDPLFVIVNGENSAAGVGITPQIADGLFSAGADAITLGNHAFNKREITGYLDSGRSIVRPANLPPGVPGSGTCTIVKSGIRLHVVNLCGRVFLDGYDDPFQTIEAILPSLDGPHLFIDFHAEATSEKAAFGFHMDGRATAVVGTHTHVQTADETVLPRGTAYITDVGMCGPYPSVIGVDKDIVLRKFTTGLPTRFEVAEASGVICAVVIGVLKETGRAISIERLQSKM